VVIVMPDPALVFAVDRRGGDVFVVLSGELDVMTLPDVSTAVGDAVADGGRQVFVDLGDVTFMSASGIGWLVQLRHVVTTLGGGLTVTSASACVRRLCTLTGVADGLGVPRLSWPTSGSHGAVGFVPPPRNGLRIVPPPS
jgi:anti-sigma B factor antagonist